MSTIDVQACLGRARAARRDGNHPRVVEALVEAWRGSREPWLGDLIDDWVDAVARERSPVGSGSVSLQQAWLDRAAQRSSADLAHLFQSIARGTGPLCAQRVQALADFGCNPVVARVFASWALEAPFDGRNRSRCLTPAFAILAGIEDPRVAPVLAKAVAQRSQTVANAGLKNWKTLELLAKTSAGWRVLEPVPAAEREGLEVPVRVRRDPAALFAKVFDAPDDLDARQVLADALLEDGDERGEFISLQVERARSGGKVTKREKELLAQHGVAWLGPLAGIFRSHAFERGFLVGGALRGHDDWTAERLRDRAWSLVEWLDVARATRSLQSTVLPMATRLRKVKGVQIGRLLDLAQQQPSSLVELEGPLGSDWSLRTLGAADALFPRLESLSLSSGWQERLEPPEVLKWLSSPLGRRLHQLEVAFVDVQTHDQGVQVHDLLVGVLTSSLRRFVAHVHTGFGGSTGAVEVELDVAAQQAKVHFNRPAPAAFFLPPLASVELSGDEASVTRCHRSLTAQGRQVRIAE